jgi:DNA modification methylase/transcriptional regulator with XRE-family HTH domain
VSVDAVLAGGARFAALRGDNLDWLARMPDASVDAVVCDPPYGLGAEPDMAEVLRAWLEGDGHFEAKGGGFMGRKWDAFVPGPRTWREVFRVLKPGGHVAAFAGTRTWDAMAIALRLAGFELRDTLQWLYGSGFPKSMAVDKAIDKRRDWRALAALQHAIRAARTALGISQSEAARRAGMIGPDERLGGGGYMWFETGMRLPTREQWPGVKAALGLADEYDAAFEAAEREVVGRVGGAEPGEKNLNVYAGGLKSAWDVTAPATDDARDWEGWGTALKPAWEPILLMRKPLAERTVAAQVLATGTGALHIAACRVGTDDTRALASPTALGVMNDDAWKAKPVMAGSASGRWPANLVLSHTWQCVPAGARRVRGSQGIRGAHSGGVYGGGRGLSDNAGLGEAVGYADLDGMETVEAWDCAPGCPVAELDRQSGVSRSGGKTGGETRRDGAGQFAGLIPGNLRPTEHTTFGDTGGASRFFPTFAYVPKASRAEREAGLDHFPRRTAAEVTRREAGSAGLAGADGFDKNPYAGAHDGTPRANPHPTVKPLALMEWLVRLITPPGGLVLDPWAGSGSTGVAVMRCAELGARFLGFELDGDGHDYVAIAAARMAHALAQPPEGAKLPKKRAERAHRAAQAVEAPSAPTATIAPPPARPRRRTRPKAGAHQYAYGLWGEPDIWTATISVGEVAS